MDIAPTLVGRDLKGLLGEEHDCEGTVVSSVEAAVDSFKPDVALVTTVSDLDKVTPVCVELLRRGVHVVSTCEEMAYPFRTQPELCAKLDEAAKAGGVVCVGTGINPGFVLDILPVFLTGPLDTVQRVRAFRVVDAGKRRGPLQRKVGAGLSPAEFDAKVRAGGFGHRGFMESLHMLCDALHVEVSGASTFIRPVIAEEDVTTEFVSVRAGQVAGIHQGAEDRDGIVVLDLKMYVGAKNPGDRIEVDGSPNIKVQVEGGYHGDVATCAITLNAIHALEHVRPGLRSMLDMPPIHSRRV
jgi:4-hydroxy-tetrahydrodipicolinate reductase